MGLRMQPRNEKFFTLFSKAGSNVVESAAILMEFVAAPHERWAGARQTHARHRARRRRHHQDTIPEGGLTQKGAMSGRSPGMTPEPKWDTPS
jgi:hypothetical protein